MSRRILLTGATGALGPVLAAELVRAGGGAGAERVAVIMRCKPGDLEQRFAQWREEVAGVMPEEERDCLSRLYPVSGDICFAGLGLGDAGDALARETDVVIHAAADTNFAAAPERQWDVNVEGTRRMLQWAETCRRLDRFLLVSSVFVSGSRTGRIDETATAEPPEFVTHYQHTKWEAERVALSSGLPVGVARISMVLGSHATGSVHRAGAIHSWIKWYARGLVPMVPGCAEAKGDAIATETAARCLARAAVADLDKAGPRIWHIAAADRAPRMREILDFVYDHFYQRPAWRRKKIARPRLVDQDEYDRFIACVDHSGKKMAAQALRSLNRFLPDLLFPKTYVTQRAEALWGGPLPQYDWRETLERVLRFCCPVDT